MAHRQASVPPYLPNEPLWGERLTAAPLPTLDRVVEADVCVIGLGGSGLAAIHALLDGGASVVALDARGVAAGAAGRNGGFLLAGLASFHHVAVRELGRDRAVRLYRHTMEQIDRMVVETPGAIRRTGSLRIASSDEEEQDCRAQLEAMRADDFPGEWYEGSEGRGLLVPTDAVYQPMQRCLQLAAQASARGARLFGASRVVRLATHQVMTEYGSVRCGRVIAAIDGRLAQLLPELASRVRSARLQMLATAPAEEVRFDRPVYTRWGFDYWQQLPDHRLVLGGFRDLHEGAEWTTSSEPTAEVQRVMEDFLRHCLAVRAPITHRWAALVSFTETGLPILEEVRPGVIAVGAYSGTGNVLGPLCARAAAQLALGRPAAIVEDLLPATRS